MKERDSICFYSTTANGVTAHARLASGAKLGIHPDVRDPENHRWLLELTEPKLYLENPVVLDGELRAQLDAFQGKDLTRNWGWFVNSTREVTADDFVRLTLG